MARRRGRGRLSSFDLMPPECDGLITQAALDLSDREKTQTEIYAEFVAGCEAIMAEHCGELDFAIPSFSSFNRYSIRQARASRRMSEVGELVKVLAKKFDAKTSDDLTILTAETIKSLVFQMSADADAERIDAKEVMHMASAFRQALQAQNISTERHRKLDEEFDAKVSDAVDTVAKAKGMTAATSEAIKAEILGVRS